MLDANPLEGLVDLAREDDAAPFRCWSWLQDARSRGGERGDDALSARWDAGHGLFAVADGVGSAHGASDAAKRTLECLAQVPLAGADRALRAAIVDAIEDAHSSLMREPSIGVTTLVVASIVDDQVRIFHCGDSGAAIISKEGEVLHHSVGHGPAQYAVAAGELEPTEILEHEEHHIVDHVVGCDPLVLASAGPLRFRKSDTLVLASDGVLDNVGWEEVAATVCRGPVSRAARVLAEQVEAQLDAGGKDDDRCFLIIRRS